MNFGFGVAAATLFTIVAFGAAFACSTPHDSEDPIPVAVAAVGPGSSAAGASDAIGQPVSADEVILPHD